MNKRLYFFGGLALAVTAVVVLAIQTHLQAQSLSKSPSHAVIEEAVALLDQGEPEAARALLAVIEPSDPEHPLAKGYDAVCLYRIDRLKFLEFYKVMQLSEMEASQLPPQLREELDYNQIDTLFFYRKFEQILPKTREFADLHGDSPKLAAVAEYQMATLYERGMKKVQEGCAARDMSSFEKRYQDGHSNLVDFLDMAVALDQADYNVLPKRSLKEEIWMAEIALGDEVEVETAIPYADRERAAFLSAQLHLKLQPRAADYNLRRMTNFLNDFPNTKYRERVEFEMADSVLCEGELLTSEARDARRAGDAITAAQKRATAAPYLETALGLFSNVVEDKEAGISEADAREARLGRLLIFYAQEDYASLSDWAAHLVADSLPEGKEWLVAKLYNGAALARQGRLTEAASELDEVLVIEFTNHPSYDGLLISAAEWRITIAMLTHDDALAGHLVKQVQSSDCYGSIKRTFLEKFHPLATQPAPATK